MTRTQPRSRRGPGRTVLIDLTAYIAALAVSGLAGTGAAMAAGSLAPGVMTGAAATVLTFGAWSRFRQSADQPSRSNRQARGHLKYGSGKGVDLRIEWRSSGSGPGELPPSNP